MGKKSVFAPKIQAILSMGKVLWIASLLSLFFPQMVFAAPKFKHLKDFRVEVPDTVVQGSDFKVSYILESTHWMAAHVTEGCGIRMTDCKFEKQDGNPYRTLIVNASFTTSRQGRIALPPMTAVVDGQEVFSAPKEVFVKPNPEYGEEMNIAHEWLVEKGADQDSLSLDFSAPVGNFYFFSDRHLRCFCLVAKKDTWSYAGNPVWAYSLECGMGEKSLKEYIPYFFKDYSELLTALEQSGKKMQEFDDDMEPVPPLLGELRWGQGAPYNSKLPVKDNKQVVVGCVPLSMAMIMKYHEWPKQGMSSLYYETGDDEKEDEKFAEFHKKVEKVMELLGTSIRKVSDFDYFDCKELTPHWEQYKNNYDEKEVEECAELSKMLGTLSLIMSPKYEDSETGANLYHFKHIMCNNMGYSGRMSLYDRPSNTTVIELLQQEITSRRPCIVSRNAHAFICDGLEKGFFHFNLGWQGHGNGYYRVPKYIIEKDSTFFRTVVVGIEPQKSEQKKEVTLVKAGTLDDLLSDEEKENLTSLTISGPINSSDIRLIRAMAGAKGDSLYDNRNMGTLRFLDLTNATISKDKIPYRTRIATKTYSGYKSYTYSDGYSHRTNYNFDFNNMNKNKWNEFKTDFAKIQKGKGLIYTRINDTKYFESSFCIKNTISSEMFSDCSSLCDIRLPKKTKAIFDAAFLNCLSLQKIQIPASTKDFGKQMFQNCLSLEMVYVPKAYWSYQKNASFGSNLSPGFKEETY